MRLKAVSRVVLLVCLLVCLVIFPTSAQDNLPWPPDPDTLFAPGVEVVSVEETQSTIEVTACGVSSFMNSGWVYYVDGDQVQLCDIGTGETRNLSPLTPEDVGYLPDEFNRAFLSPDEVWLVYARDVAVPGTNGQRVVSGYRLADGYTHLLGTIDLPSGMNRPNAKGFAGWLSDTHGTMVIDIFGDFVADDYFIYDVTQPDSLKPVGSGFYRYYPDPLRYEWIMNSASLTFYTSLPYRVDCMMSLFDAQGEYLINLGYDCIGARALYAGGQYFTLQIEAEDSTTSNLLRFDPRTDERNVLLTDEIEWLVGVSPDGRYALLLMDDNGQLDMVREDFPTLHNVASYGDLLSDGTTHIALWDRDTSKIIHEITVTPDPDKFRPNFEHLWCGDDCLMYAYGCAEDYSALPVTLLRFDENQDMNSKMLEVNCYELGLGDHTLLSPDTRYLFHRLAPILFIEVDTATSYPLFAEAYEEGYRVHQAEWLDAETLKIWLRQSDMLHPGEIAYTLNLSALFESAGQ